MLAGVVHAIAAAAAMAGSAQAPPPTPAPQVPLERMVGAKVMGGFAGTSPDAALLRRVRRGQLGGVILFGDNIGSAHGLRSTIRRLRHAARQGGAPGLLVAIDQEGGIVKRLSAGPPRLAPREMRTERVARREGAATGRYLASFGIDVDLAPVMDVASPGSFITSRSFGRDPGRVATLANAFAGGLRAAHVAATAKHFPGLGRARLNTDTSSSTIHASLTDLREDELPFQLAAIARIPLVMVSNAVYPALGSRKPASLSRRIVTGELRGHVGFEGVTISDSLEAAAILRVTSVAKAAVSAARAGVDIELVASPGAAARSYQALLRAARSGRLPRDELAASYARIRSLQLGG